MTFGPPADVHGNPVTGYTATCASTNGGVTGTNSGATSPITVTGLTNAKTYTCSVTATNIIGTGAASPNSASAVPFTIPAAPSIDTPEIGNASLKVSFAPGSNNGAAITGFTVTCYSSRGGGFTGTASGASSPITVAGLSNGWAYICEVTATNTAGTSAPSDPSPAVTVGAPAPPKIVSVVPALASGPVGDLKIFSGPAPTTAARSCSTARCASRSRPVRPDSTTARHHRSRCQAPPPGGAYDCTVFSWNGNGAGTESPAVRAVVGTPERAEDRQGHAGPERAGAGVPAGRQQRQWHRRLPRARCTSTDGGVSSAPLQLTSPIVAGNLTPGKTYTCALTAINARGESPPTTTSPIVTTAVEVTTGCKGGAGSLRVSPGLLFSINKPHTFRLAAQLGRCSGNYARKAKISMTFRSKTPFSCKQAIGKANGGSGTITWTAPEGLGASDAAIQLVFGATHGHVTNARFHGTITSRANSSPIST